MKKTNDVGRAGVLLLAASCVILAESSASSQAALPKPPGIWCERSSCNAISYEHERRLVLSLRRITGFGDAGFAADGALSLGDTSAAKDGAPTARQILFRVLRSGMVFMIEDHSGSDLVTFGQLDGGTVYESLETKRLVIWRVRLDFKDFRQVQGSPQVRSSFDEGFTLLHELLHGLGCQDASRAEEIGKCEELVNQARTELGLPLRDQYSGVPFHVAAGITSVQLRFRSWSPASGPGRSHWHYLYFLLRTPLLGLWFLVSGFWFLVRGLGSDPVLHESNRKPETTNYKPETRDQRPETIWTLSLRLLRRKMLHVSTVSAGLGFLRSTLVASVDAVIEVRIVREKEWLSSRSLG